MDFVYMFWIFKWKLDNKQPFKHERSKKKYMQDVDIVDAEFRLSSANINTNVADSK